MFLQASVTKAMLGLACAVHSSRIPNTEGPAVMSLQHPRDTALAQLCGTSWALCFPSQGTESE